MEVRIIARSRRGGRGKAEARTKESTTGRGKKAKKEDEKRGD